MLLTQNLRFVNIYTSRGHSEVGYRAGLSRRRSRVRAPLLASKTFLDGKVFFIFFVSGISAAGSALASGVRGRRFESAIPDIFLRLFFRLRRMGEAAQSAGAGHRRRVRRRSRGQPFCFRKFSPTVFFSLTGICAPP